MDYPERLLYHLFKMVIGVVCLILSAEYGWAYAVYSEASFRILYVADLATWLFAGMILFLEGAEAYVRILRETVSARDLSVGGVDPKIGRSVDPPEKLDEEFSST